MTDWKIGQSVRVWRGATLNDHDAGGYEYGIIETIDDSEFCLCEDCQNVLPKETDVMLIGDGGREIYCQVKDLEAG